MKELTARDTRFIFTCRPSIEYLSEKFTQIKLPGLSHIDSIELFSQYKIKFDDDVTEVKICELCDLTNGHPLWLNLIATQIRRHKYTLSAFITNIRKSDNKDAIDKILEPIWANIQNKQKNILRVMAELLRPEPKEQISKYCNLSFIDFRTNFNQLCALNLIITKTHHAGVVATKYDLHPLVRHYVRSTYNLVQRVKYIRLIGKYYDDIIKKYRKHLREECSFFTLEAWVNKAELMVNAGEFCDAIEAVHDVMYPLQRSGYNEELSRITIKIFDGINFHDAILNQYPHFDKVFSAHVENLSTLGRFDNANESIVKYEEAIAGNGAQFINLCNVKAYYNWNKKDYEEAMFWGKRGKDLKESSALDTVNDCKHNFALALRDGGFPKEALEIFLGEISLNVVVSNYDLNINKNSAFYGNIGRCLWLLSDINNAFTCYLKSYKLLTEESDMYSFVNRGWAAFWIAEYYQITNNEYYSLLFYYYAYRIWEKVSPHRANDANNKIMEFSPDHDIFNNIKKLDIIALKYNCDMWIETILSGNQKTLITG